MAQMQRHSAEWFIEKLDEEMGRLKRDMAKVVLRCIKVGERLIQAKEKLPHGEFLYVIEETPDLTERAAQRFMSMARCKVLQDERVAPSLPASWRTVYEISRLPEDTIVKAVDKGLIHVGMERKDVAELKNPRALKKQKPRHPNVEDEMLKVQERLVAIWQGATTGPGALSGYKRVATEMERLGEWLMSQAKALMAEYEEKIAAENKALSDEDEDEDEDGEW